MKKRVHLWVYGRVQGVNFRYYTRQKALSLGLTGWVRNLPDGGVECIAEGEETMLLEFVQWCAHGPVISRVEEIEKKWEAYKGEFSAFDISYQE